MRVIDYKDSQRRPTHGFGKLWWLTGGLVISLVVSASMLRYRDSTLQTDYATGYTAERFRQLAVGMPVEDVLDQIGKPFLYRVPSLGSDGYFTNQLGVGSLLISGTNEVVLEYSRARDGENFRARQVVVLSGRVIRVDAYDYWGD